MRHRDRRPYELLTDQPGVVVHDPRRKLAKLLVLYAVLPLICSAAGAFIAYQLGQQAMSQRVAALEEDLAARRDANTAANAERDARLAQTRRDLCVVVDRVQPRDAAVQDLRRRYGCTAGPSPTPSPGASPPATGRPAPGGTGSSGGQSGGDTRPAAKPSAPAPRPPVPPGSTRPPAPPPAPEPEPSRTHLLDVCVPLLDLCV